MSSHRTVKPGVPASETWSTQLVMPAQPAPGECRHKQAGRQVEAKDSFHDVPEDATDSGDFNFQYGW